MDREFAEALAAARAAGDAAAAETVSRAQVDQSSDDLGFPEATVAMLADELQEHVEYFTPHGVYFRPLDGAEGIALAVLGDPDHRVLVDAYSRGVRPVKTCAEGEGGLYGRQSWVLFLDSGNVLHLGGGAGREPEQSDAEADDAKAKPSLRLHPDGTVEVLRKDGTATLTVSPDGTVVVRSDDIRLGSETADQALAAAEETKAELERLRVAFDGHVHGTSEGDTTTPTPNEAIGVPLGSIRDIAAPKVRTD